MFGGGDIERERPPRPSATPPQRRGFRKLEPCSEKPLLRGGVAEGGEVFRNYDGFLTSWNRRALTAFLLPGTLY